jgi:hypothetical protein
VHNAAQHGAQVTGHSTRHTTTCRSTTTRAGTGNSTSVITRRQDNNQAMGNRASCKRTVSGSNPLTGSTSLSAITPLLSAAICLVVVTWLATVRNLSARLVTVAARTISLGTGLTCRRPRKSGSTASNQYTPSDRQILALRALSGTQAMHWCVAPDAERRRRPAGPPACWPPSLDPHNTIARPLRSSSRPERRGWCCRGV